MELGPIFRALMHNKARFWLITLEVALTLAIVVNCVNLMVDMRRKFMRPTGLDEENIVVVDAELYGPGYKEQEFLDSVRERDLERLAAIPGVRAATATSAIPLSGGGSASGRKVLGSKLQVETSPYFEVTPDAVEALGIEIAAGRGFLPEDFRYEEDEDGNAINRNVLMTRTLADVLFPDGDALGGRIENSSGEITNTVVGIIERMHCSWPLSQVAERVMLLPGKPGSAHWGLHYLVRTEPGALDAVHGSLEAAVLGVQPDRIVKLKTLAEYKATTYARQRALIKILGVVIVLIVLVTSLGVIGLTAFSVTERTRQIGTRRALGATRLAIARYFLIENWIVTAIGLTLGAGLAYALNYALAHVAEAPKLEWTFLAVGVVSLWLIGLTAALAPALRATTVSPEIATRTV